MIVGGRLRNIGQLTEVQTYIQTKMIVGGRLRNIGQLTEVQTNIQTDKQTN